MKNTKLLLFFATVMLIVSCAKKQQPVPEVQKPKEPKILVLYYSQTSNTKAVAQEIAKRLNTAVDGYPMLHAKAKTFASRNIPNGVEYLFYAIDLPRKDNPKMPAVGELQVYVTVENGKAPVFTKVIR